MLSASDSFIEYLADNLSPFEVFWWRPGDIEAHAGVVKQNAVNVKILGFWGDGNTEMCLISLDVLGPDERTALEHVKDLRDLLIALQTIPERDFSDPDNPAFTGRSISWDGRRVRFISVRTPSGARYSHYNATFPLTYTRD